MSEKTTNTTNTTDTAKKIYTLKDAPLSLVNTIANTIVKSLFLLNEDKTEQKYLSQYQELIPTYIELVSFYPEMEFKDMDLEEFFEGYVEGKYDDLIHTMKGNRRVQYLDRVVNYTIETKLRYESGGRLENSVAKFLSSLTEAVQNFGDYKTEDIQNFLKGFNNLSEKITPESLSEAVIKIHQKEDKKPKKTRKTAQETVNTAQ